MGYQNFFATKLYTDIGAADTTITLETAPTPTSGRLVLEARNSTQREIISYTGVSGNQITGVTRGVGGTTAKTHVKTALVEMNAVAEDFTEALAVVTDINDKWDKTFVDYVQNGLVWSLISGLNATMTAGVVYIDGIKATFSAVATRAFTVSKDTYIDVGNNGTIYYNEVTNGAAQPAFTAGRIRIAVVATNASAITYVVNYPNGNSLATDDGWNNRILPTVSTVVANGNRNYTLTHASSVAAWVSSGTRRQFQRVAPINQYVGGLLNGSSHYFIKATPTGSLSTVANNFTVTVAFQPASFQSTQNLLTRCDATAANYILLRMESTGVVTVAVANGGAGNTRSQATYTALDMTRETVVTATWASGTATIYFDGVSQPLQAQVTTGTAPTTAGTAGDWAIGRLGANNSQWANGYLSNAGVFDAVLSAATIKAYATKLLTGAETNCIGAWSLNNTAVNQANPGTNDMTATGGVGYSLGISPFGNKGASAITEYGVTMSLSADGLTEVVQCPEGCALPDGTATIQSSSFSYETNPLGFVADKGRWEVRMSCLVGAIFTNPVGGTYYNPGSLNIQIPAGTWDIKYRNSPALNPGASIAIGITSGISTSTSTFTDRRLYQFTYVAAATDSHFSHSRDGTISLSAMTVYYVVVVSLNSATGNLSSCTTFTPLYVICTPTVL